MSFFSELKRRRVFRVAALYGVTAWILTEVSSVVMPALLLPEWTVTFVVVLLILGFPIAMILAWLFDIGPGGIERTAPAQSSATTLSARRSYLFYGLLLLAATATLSVVLYFRGVGGMARAGPASSIAVLPFANLSGDEEKDYFSDGMAEELLNLLANVQGLNVAARTSSFSYRDQQVDVRKVGRELGVDTVLEGSVRWAGERVRITAQLIDTSTGYHLWSETYDRHLQDIFAVQDEIAKRIVDALRIHLTPAERAGLNAGTLDREAQDLYWRGRHVWKRRGADAIRSSIELFQAAIGRDPGYGRAHAALAAAYVLLPEYADEPQQPAFEQAAASAMQALTLDATLAEAHAVLALIAMQRGEWLDAEFKFVSATALDPSEPTPHQWYSNLLDGVGRLDAALEQARQAYELDDTSPVLAANMANVHLARGDNEQVLKRAAEAEQLGLASGMEGPKAIALLRLGRIEEARPLAYKLGEHIGRSPEQMDVYIAAWQHEAVSDEVVRSLLDDATLPRDAAFNFALVAGKIDAAYSILEGIERPLGMEVVGLFWFPEAAEFRRDPRFAPLVERLGLIEYWKHYGWPEQCAETPQGISCS